MSAWARLRAERHAERRLGRPDFAGEAAVQLAQMAYLRAQLHDRPLEEQDDIREFICIAKGWEFRR